MRSRDRKDCDTKVLEVKLNTGEAEAEVEENSVSCLDFQQRCREAALTARTVMPTVKMLCEERERIGFVPIPVGDYISSLARAIHVEIDSILAAFRIKDIKCPDAEQAFRVARLYEVLGMTRRETRVATLLSVAQTRQIPTDMVYAQSCLAEASELQEDCEDALDHLKAETSPGVRKEIITIENAIHNAFGMDEHTHMS